SAQSLALRRPQDVPRRRHPRQSGPHEHGARSRSSGAVPRPPRRRVRGRAARGSQAPRTNDEISPPRDHAPVPATGDPRQAEAGLRSPHRPLAPTRAPGDGGGRAVGSAGAAAWVVQPARREAALGEPSRGRLGREPPALAAAHAGAVVPDLRGSPGGEDLRMKVLLVGAYPPPYGGIAVQIQHLTRALPRAGVACRVLDIGGGRGAPSAGYESVTGPVDFVAKLIRYARSGYMLHLFTNGENWKSWIVALVVSVVGTLARAHAIVTITSGGAPSYLGRARAPLRALARLAVKLPAALVCRTEAIAQALAPWRGSAPLVLPAFSLSRLHPAKRLPEAVASFAARHRPL